MALIQSIGFDAFTSPSDFLSPFSSTVTFGTASIADSEGKFGERCFKVNHNDTNLPTAKFVVDIRSASKAMAGTKLRFGWWHRANAVTSGGISNRIACRLYDFTMSYAALLYISDYNGALCFARAGDLATMRTGTRSITDDNWHWIEVEVVLNTSGGSVQAYVDGMLDLSYTGVTASSAASIANTYGYLEFFGGMSSGSSSSQAWFFAGEQTYPGIWRMDDLLVWDDQGTSFNTFPIRQQRITTRFPSSTVSNDYTGNTALAADVALSDTTKKTDIDYIEAGTVGASATFAIPALSFTPGTVTAVVVKASERNTDATARTVRWSYTVGATTLPGTTTTLPSSYALSLTYSALAPSGSAWTASDLNALAFGPQVVT